MNNKYKFFLIFCDLNEAKGMNIIMNDQRLIFLKGDIFNPLAVILRKIDSQELYYYSDGDILEDGTGDILNPLFGDVRIIL